MKKLRKAFFLLPLAFLALPAFSQFTPRALPPNLPSSAAVYRQYFGTTYPARVCVAVKQLPLNANIEISAIARVPSFH